MLNHDHLLSQDTIFTPEQVLKIAAESLSSLMAPICFMLRFNSALKLITLSSCVN